MGVIVRFALFALGAYLLFAFVRKLLSAPPQAPPSAAEAPPRNVSQLVQDPNCGVYVDVQAAVARTVGHGKVFFCSEQCADAWQAKKRGA